MLDFDGAADRLDDTWELDKCAVAGQFYDPPVTLDNLGIDQIAPVRLEACKRILFVGTHEPGIADNVSGKDRHQLAFENSLNGARCVRVSFLRVHSNSAVLAKPDPLGDVQGLIDKDRLSTP